MNYASGRQDTLASFAIVGQLIFSVRQSWRTPECLRAQRSHAKSVTRRNRSVSAATTSEVSPVLSSRVPQQAQNVLCPGLRNVSQPLTTARVLAHLNTMQPVIFDDGCKENSRPTKAGRNPATAGLRSRAPGEADPRIADRERHLAAIKATEATPTPLAAWVTYVRWIQDAYPTGGIESGLLSTLESVTRLYAGDARFTNDPEYVKLWVTYADLLSDPADVFRYMNERGIGQSVALFYMAWSWLAEHRGDFALADKVYSLGVMRSAAPLDRLKLRYKEFQRRMYKKWIASSGGGVGAALAAAGGAATPAAPTAQLTAEQLTALSSDSLQGRAARAPVAADENGHAAAPAAATGAVALPRGALSHLSAAGAALSYRPQMTAAEVEDAAVARTALGSQQRPAPQGLAARILGPAGAGPSALAGSGATARAPAPGPRSGGFAVFSDSDATDGAGGLSAAPSGVWPVLPTEQQRTKENTQQPLKWTDPAAVLPPRAAAAFPPVAASTEGSRFLVFADESKPAREIASGRPPRSEAPAYDARASASAVLPPAAARKAMPATVLTSSGVAPPPSSAPPPGVYEDSKPPAAPKPEALSYEEQRAEHWWRMAAQRQEAVAASVGATTIARPQSTAAHEDDTRTRDGFTLPSYLSSAPSSREAHHGRGDSTGSVATCMLPSNADQSPHTARLSSVDVLRALLGDADDTGGSRHSPAASPLPDLTGVSLGRWHAAPALPSASAPPHNPAARPAASAIFSDGDSSAAAQPRPALAARPALAVAPSAPRVVEPAQPKASADHDDMTLHSKLAADEIEDLFASPSLPSGLLGRRAPRIPPPAAVAQALAEAPPRARVPPPGARRLSAAVLNKGKTFEVFSDF